MNSAKSCKNILLTDNGSSKQIIVSHVILCKAILVHSLIDHNFYDQKSNTHRL